MDGEVEQDVAGDFFGATDVGYGCEFRGRLEGRLESSGMWICTALAFGSVAANRLGLFSVFGKHFGYRGSEHVDKVILLPGGRAQS
jgi:hypothetical protein